MKQKLRINPQDQTQEVKSQIDNLYEKPREYIQMIASGVSKQRGLIISGPTGLGKTYNVKKILNDNKIEYESAVGHITSLMVYEKLYQARSKGSIILFDDVEILQNTTNLNFIKAALNESASIVEYQTSKPIGIPKKFLFEGKIIILLNEVPRKNSEHYKAIASRMITYILEFSREQRLEIIKELAEMGQEGLSKKEVMMIFEWIKSNTKLSTKNLNLRLFFQAIDFYKWNKAKWEELTLAQIDSHIPFEYTPEEQFVIQGMGEKEFIDKTGKHRATYYRMKDKLKPELRVNPKDEKVAKSHVALKFEEEKGVFLLDKQEVNFHYRPDYISGHIAFTSKEPNPLTDTGYLSHFIGSLDGYENIMRYIEDFVKAELQKDKKTKGVEFFAYY